MTFMQDDFDYDRTVKNERLLTSIYISLIVGFMVFDILDDWYEGLSIYHLIPEALVAIVGMGTIMLLFVRLSKSRHVAFDKARTEVIEAKKQALQWQNQAQGYREGLTEAISRQLTEWDMTDAEKDICFLLLKGFSLQEIANLRNTAERTVRQQASLIYKKTGLSGRVQLSAFFLEDLLLPQNT